MTAACASGTTVPLMLAVTHAERWIAGEFAAAALIARIKADMDAPADLASLLNGLDGSAFDGACAALQKALRLRHE